jgi:RND family efflux transporter MFP subunit
LLAINRAELKAEELGRVTRIAVREGDRVSAGTVLSSQAEDDLIIAVKVADAHLSLVKVKAEQASRDNDRFQKLLGKSRVTHKDAQQAETAYQAAMAEVYAAESNLNLAKNHVRKSRIVAPFSGEIAQRFIQPGEILAPGQTAFTMVDNRKLEIEANLPADSMAKLKVGMKALFKVSGFNEPFQAVLTNISGSVQQDSRTLRVRLEVSNHGNRLKSGLFAEGEIFSNSKSGKPALPSAIVTAVGRDANIFVVENNIACYRKVLVGPEQNGWRPVHNLEIGTKVVAQGRNLVLDGTPIQISKNPIPELEK